MEHGEKGNTKLVMVGLGFSIYDPGCFGQFLKGGLYVLGSSGLLDSSTAWWATAHFQLAAKSDDVG